MYHSRKPYPGKKLEPSQFLTKLHNFLKIDIETNERVQLSNFYFHFLVEKTIYLNCLNFINLKNRKKNNLTKIVLLLLILGISVTLFRSVFWTLVNI